jgi:hypothetical protein
LGQGRVGGVVGEHSRWMRTLCALRRLRWLGAFGVTALVGLVLSASSGSGAGTPWQWYTVDTHAHSVISGDAYPDLPIMARNAQTDGINALMVGDHNLASSFPVSGVTANNVTMDEKLNRWYTGSFGTLTSSTNTLQTTHVNTGTMSLHLASTSSTGGETYERAKRGSNFRSGDDRITFSLYPVRLDPGSGLYISASVGGDATIETPTGYTTPAGTVLGGKSNVFVYYFGSPPPTSWYGSNARVVATPLTASSCDKAFALNTWITCSVTLDHTLPAIPSSEQPLDYDAFTELKMSAYANGGTADGYFDTYSAVATAPVPAADEFVFRDTFVHNYDTSTFKIFPGVEMGVSKHTHRFNFDITSASQFKSYQNGVDGIGDTQATGYPTQVDHPTAPGGISASEVTSTNADGSDLMEVRQQAMIDAWDTVLEKGVPLIGTWSSESHNGFFSGGTQTTHVYAPALDFDSLMHSMFEGRMYLAPANFGSNRLIFNLDGSAAPYPARYPVYIPAAQTTANVHLNVTGGIASGSNVVWVVNGAKAAPIAASGSYSVTKPVAISGTSTYVRAELRSSSGLQTAMSEPIFFKTVSGLPAGVSFHVDSVSSSTQPVYSNTKTKGITAASYNGTSGVLSLTLTNTAGTTAELLGTAPSAPASVTIDSAAVPPSSSLTAFQSATGDAWFYDASSTSLYVQDVQSATTSPIAIALSGGGANTPPSANGVTLSATAGVAATWTPSVSDANGDTLTCAIVAPPTHGSATVNSDCSSGTYTADAGYSGADSFTYKANDGQADSAPATVSVTVSAGGGGGGGTVALVQQHAAGGTAATEQVNLNAASQSGDALVAEIAIGAGSSASVTSVTDSAGGSWTKGPVGFLSGFNTRIEIWYRVGAPAVTSVTATLSAAKPAAVNVSEWSGIATTGAVDGSAQGGTASATSISTPSLSTTNATDLVVGAVNYSAAASSTLNAGGFTSLLDFNASTTVHGRAAFTVTSTAGSSQAAWTLSAASGGNGGAIIAFKAAGGGGGSQNTPPTAGAVSLTATSGVATSWTPSVSDANGDVLTCAIVTPAAHGTASVAGDCSTGSYTSNAAYTGSDSFTYKANDGQADSAPAAVSVTVGGGGGGGGSIAYVQDRFASGSAATVSATLATPSQAGDALVATIALAAGSSASVTNVTDSAGGTWTKGPVGFLTGTNSRVEIWYRLGASSVTTVTATLSASKAVAVDVSEWSGVATTAAVDASAQGGTASATTVSTPSLTTLSPADLVLGAVNYPAAATSTLTTAAFTGLPDVNASTSVHLRGAYAITTGAGAYQPTWSLSAASGGSGGAIIALKGA